MPLQRPSGMILAVTQSKHTAVDFTSSLALIGEAVDGPQIANLLKEVQYVHLLPFGPAGG
jgi:hypothetical protein